MLHDFISLYAIEEKSKRTGDHGMTIFGITTLTTICGRSKVRYVKEIKDGWRSFEIFFLL